MVSGLWQISPITSEGAVSKRGPEFVFGAASIFDSTERKTKSMCLKQLSGLYFAKSSEVRWRFCQADAVGLMKSSLPSTRRGRAPIVFLVGKPW